MTCEREGDTIICGRRSRRFGVCVECGHREATRLCDGPLPRGIVHRRSSVPGGSKTCSKPICTECATHVPPDADYCREHRDPASRKLAL